MDGLTLLALAVAIALSVLALLSYRAKHTLHAAAQAIFLNLTRTYDVVHEWRAARAADFPNVPEQGYADIARPLIEDEAFTLLGDLENVTLTAVHPRERTFVRVLSGDDGVVVAGTYWAQGEQYLDLATEFEDGHTISTTTATPAGFLTARPNVERHVEDAHTPPLSLLALHRKLVAEHQRATGALPLRILSLGDAVTAQQRAHERTRAHRQSLGYITEDEFHALAYATGMDLGPALPMVYEELKRLIAAHRKT